MNIIKFNNITIEGDDLYNDIFRNKYSYCINWKYVIPLNGISSDEYIEMSQNEELINEYNGVYLLINDYVTNIDQIETEKANSISRWLVKNNYTTSDIDINNLKQFRTLLAQMILDAHAFNDTYDFSCYTDNNQQIVNMLKYYANNMNDCTVQGLSLFVDMPSIQSIYKSTACGCGSNAENMTTQNKIDYTKLYGQYAATSAIQIGGCGCGSTQTTQVGLSGTCDPMLMYRMGVYNYMVSVFSDINFWTLEDHIDICEWMKSYIDEIVKLGFVLSSSIIDKFADCTCNNVNNSEQERLMGMLKNLSTALGYILNNEVAGNRNFISTSITDWAVYLYEKMQWA